MSVPKPKIRDWQVRLALDSFASLLNVLMGLTEDEVIAALSLESQSRRRQSIMDRLTSRAARLNEINYVKKLKEQYHGTSSIEGPVGS